LIGAGWLVLKGEGELRAWAFKRIPRLAVAVLVVMALAFVVALTLDIGAIAQGSLQARRWGLVFPAVGVAALIGVITSARAQNDALPFAFTTLFFIASYLTLGVMFGRI
jgi:cytochrome d ubiquinol oxidase subunit II